MNTQAWQLLRPGGQIEEWPEKGKNIIFNLTELRTNLQIYPKKYRYKYKNETIKIKDDFVYQRFPEKNNSKLKLQSQSLILKVTTSKFVQLFFIIHDTLCLTQLLLLYTYINIP